MDEKEEEVEEEEEKEEEKEKKEKLRKIEMPCYECKLVIMCLPVLIMQILVVIHKC